LHPHQHLPRAGARRLDLLGDQPVEVARFVDDDGAHGSSSRQPTAAGVTAASSPAVGGGRCYDVAGWPATICESSRTKRPTPSSGGSTGGRRSCTTASPSATA